MNVLDLFSGIGGFSVGLERAGMRTVAFCEKDAYCRAVLRKHWPDVPCWADIRHIDADGLDQLGAVDLICGGFPCQPYSVAGNQKGKEDDRDLWPEMRRVIALSRPAWVLAENVTGLITVALDSVLADLECLSYATRAVVIPAAGVGAPHRRERLWIIATHANGDALRNDQQREARRRDHLQDGRHPELGDDGKARVFDGLREVQELDDASANASDSSGARLPIPERSPVSRARRQQERRATTQRDWWSAEPDVGRVAYGIPNRVDRLRALGNAVVPQIPEIIGRAIMSASGR